MFWLKKIEVFERFENIKLKFSTAGKISQNTIVATRIASSLLSVFWKICIFDQNSVVLDKKLLSKRTLY